MKIESKEELLIKIKKFSKETKASEIIEMLQKQGIEFEDDLTPTPSTELSILDVGQSLAEIKSIAFGEGSASERMEEIKELLNQC